MCRFCDTYGPDNKFGCVHKKDQPTTASTGSFADIKSLVPELEGTYPVVLYFGTDADRSEFMELMAEAKPGMVARKL